MNFLREENRKKGSSGERGEALAHGKGRRGRPNVFCPECKTEGGVLLGQGGKDCGRKKEGEGVKDKET